MSDIGINWHRNTRYQTGGNEPFTNVMKMVEAREVTGGSTTTPFSGGAVGSRRDLDWGLTLGGYPNTGQVFHCYCPCFKDGTHKITWTGGVADVVYFNGDAGIGDSAINNEITLTGVEAGTNRYKIRIGAGVSNLIIKHVDDIASGDKYTAGFDTYYSPFDTYRSMVAGETNETPGDDFTWTSNYDTNWMTYYAAYGIPPDERVNMVNHLAIVAGEPRALWDNIHDVVVTKDASVNLVAWLSVYNGLDAGNKVYIELSNEPWNNQSGSAFVQSKRFQDLGIANSDLDSVASSDFKKRMMQYAIMSADVHNQAVITVTTPTFEVILNGQASNNGTINYLAEAPFGTNGQVSDVVKHVSIAPYIGSSRKGELFDIDDLIARLFADYEKRWFIEKQWQKTLDKSDAKFEKTSIYECNTHDDDNLALNDNQQVTDLVRAHYEALIAGQNPFDSNTFRKIDQLIHFGADGTGSYWDTELNSTRMAMLLDLIGVAAPPDPPVDPLNPTSVVTPSSQTLQPLSISATVEATIDASGSFANEPNESIPEDGHQYWVTPLPTASVPQSVANPTFTLDAPGAGETLYTIEHQATDTAGNKSPKTSVAVTVETPNKIPIANALLTQQVVVIPLGQTSTSVTLDGTASTDSDGFIIQSVWGGDLTGLGLTVVINNVVAGLYNSSLEVTDNNGETSIQTAASSAQITVEAAPVIPDPPTTPVGGHPASLWIIPDTGNLNVKAVGNYTPATIAGGSYYNDAIVDHSTTPTYKQMGVQIYRAVDIDNHKKIPTIIWLADVGYEATPFTGAVADTHCQTLASMGCTVFSIECRIESNSPFSPGDDVNADSDITRAINALELDIHRAVEFARQNVFNEFYNISGDMIFIGGNDVAALGAMQYIQQRSDTAIAGLIMLNAAFGFGSTWTGDEIPDTTDLRNVFNETQWTNPVPVFHAVGSADTYLSNITALQTKLAESSSNVIEIVAGENHTDPDTWTLAGGGTTWEAIREFIQPIVETKPTSTSRVTF